MERDDTIKNHIREEQADAAKIPALITNRFIVISGGLGVRLSFGEQAAQGTRTAMHTSILLSLDDTKALLDVLNQVVDSTSRPQSDSDEDGLADA